MKRRIFCMIVAVSLLFTLMPTAFAETINDVELSSSYNPRTTAPNTNNVYYGRGNVFYQNGFYGWCTWYAYGRAYEILGSRPNLPSSAASKWFNECNSYPKSTNYYAAKVGAIACYSNHVSVVEAVGSNGAPLYVSEGGFLSNIPSETCTYLTTSGISNLHFHYGKDYAKGFKGYIYILDGSSSSGGAQAHTHDWGYYEDAAHPHRRYRRCTCGAKEYMGTNNQKVNCQQCYPLGSVSFKRSYDKFAKTATFYRNNVSNANTYSVTLYRDGSYYNSFQMNSTSYTVSNLGSGSYYATLTVINGNTGQIKTATTSSFKIVDSYPVTYNANGGTNTPSQQSKIKDEYLTITSSMPTRAHYIFKGWASSKTATEPQYKPGDYYTKNTAITLYAVWEPEIYTVNFDPNGGDGDVTSTKITYGNTMKMPNDITRQGYYLKGWSKDQSSQNAEYRIGEDYGFDKSMTLYAVWGKSTWQGDVASGFAGGDGTEGNPYQISNAAELAYFAKKVNEQVSAPKYEYYILTSNIGLGFDEWTPIGVFDYDSQYFYGSFDGNGYTISDLSMSQINAGYVGLFGYAKDSEIKNLTFSGEAVNINSTSTTMINIGELVGYSDNTNITNCTAKYVNISNIAVNYANIGCVAGKSSGGQIAGCNAEESNIIIKSAEGSLYAGIICGNSDSDISDCSVSSTSELFETTGEISSLDIGGICGSQTGGNIEKCTVNAGKMSANDITARNVNIGGIVGYIWGNMSLCTVKFTDDSVKEIEGESYPVSISAVSSGISSEVGGIAGASGDSSKFKDCMYNGKSISSYSNGYSYVGGLMGSAYAGKSESTAISRSFANIDGILLSNGAEGARSGGIIGYGTGTKGEAKNLLSVADKISSKATSSSYSAYAGDIIGYNRNSAFDFSTVFSNSSLTLSAVNTANSANAKTETISTQQTDSQLKRVATLNRIFGPDTYQSLKYLEENPEAVWVIKDGELPELYYNVLRDITVDKIENGTISVDKLQAVDGERVAVTATPAEGYQLNKIYVNGEITGDTFVVNGDSTVYATFSEKTPEYEAKVEANDNAAAALIDVDSGAEASLASAEDTISAQDGSEIRVDTEADTDYAVENVYVNGEEMTSKSFIITEDTVVTLDVVDISTNIQATTGDATGIGDYFATLSGSVQDVEGAERYIRYWEENNPGTVYTTEVLSGSGEYSVEVTELIPGTTYCYQMCDTGEVKSFIAQGLDISNPDDVDAPIETETPIAATVNMSQTATAYTFEVKTEDTYYNCYVYVAIYDKSGILLSADVVPLEVSDITTVIMDKMDNAAAAKVYIWSDNLQPILENATEFDLS